MIKRHYSYLLWDHDGIMVDTEPWYFRANQLILEKHGVMFTPEQYMPIMTAGGSALSLMREAGFSESQIESAREEREAQYRYFLRTESIDIPDAREIIRRLADNYRMAVVTSSNRRNFDVIHEHRDLIDPFEFVLTLEDYEGSKPDPEPYLAALHRFHAHASEALIIEDSERGLSSAVAAGIDCVIIRHEFTQSQDFRKAAAVLNHLDELPGWLQSRQ